MSSGKHISLGMVFHNHQPVGQVDHVFEEAFKNTYDPVIGALERHPGVRVGLHYTGSLLDWLREHRPDYMQRVRALVQRGQVEVLSGGYYEPILPSIPDDDKLSQLNKLSDAVRNDFGYEPTGMWLAERVWEPNLPTPLSRAGIEWTVLDDVHFKMAGLTDEGLTGYFVTENNGSTVNVFATSKTLRYTIPWRPVQETMDFLRAEAIPTPGKVLVMGDDGEKFGGWPDTYQHCWGNDGHSGWVDEFFTALEENSTWLHTVKLGEQVRHFPAVGRVYLPTASYNEMMGWALPAAQGREFSTFFDKLEAEKDPALAFVRGGFWRNFMVKYPEVNFQHKKMLRVHDQIAEALQKPEDRPAEIAEALEDLWRGQSNDTYWHGLFGGIYLTDLRVRVQGHLLRAQQAAERVLHGDSNWLHYETCDFDLDSLQELLIEGNAINLYIALAQGGSIFAWDLRHHNFPLGSIVSRRPESYHQALRDFEEQRRAKPKRGKKTASEGLSPHENIRVKEEGLDRYLNYDAYPRNSMMDHFIGPGTTLEAYTQGRYNEEGDFIYGAYKADLETIGDNILHVILERDGHITTETGRRPVRLTKRLSMKAGSPNFRVHYTIQNTGTEDLTAIFGSEWNLNLLGGGHNPSAYFRGAGEKLEDAALDSTGEMRNVREFAMGNTWLDIEMVCRTNLEATLWRYPIGTVSGSEGGYERTYQGSSILLQWLMKLPPDDSLELEVEWSYKGLSD